MAGALAATLLATGPGRAAAQEPERTTYYQHAAQLYRKAAAQKSCPQNRDCYLRWGDYYANPMLEVSETRSRLDADPRPACQIFACARGGGGDPLVPGLPPATANTGMGADGTTTGTLPENEADFRTLRALNKFAGALLEQSDRPWQSGAGSFDQQAALARIQGKCFEHYSAELRHARRVARPRLSCALRFRALPRFPRLDPPPRCATAPMKALLLEASSALLDGDAPRALELYTQVWLANPEWPEPAVARALLLEATGETEEAAGVLEAYRELTFKLPGWDEVAVAEGERKYRACVDAGRQAAEEGLDERFPAARCGWKP